MPLPFRWVVGATLLAATSSFAAPVIVGSMSRVAGSDLIVDSLNHREWIGWDATRGLSYSQTIAATQSGGAFDGFAVANGADALLFLDALLGTPHYCSDPAASTCAASESPQREMLVGESYFTSSQWYQADYEYVFYLSDSGTGQAVGALEVHTAYLGLDSVSNYSEWGTFADSDAYAVVPQSIGWLLFRQSSSGVPEPGTVALAGLALLTLSVTRRRSTPRRTHLTRGTPALPERLDVRVREPARLTRRLQPPGRAPRPSSCGRRRTRR